MATQDGTSAESEAEIRKLSTELHAKAQAQDDGVKVYTQEDLMALGVIPDNELTLLMSCINVLSSEGLVKVMSKDNRPCFKIQSKQDAARYRGLTDEEGIVFGYIESAGREGIWTRTIRSKSNLHQNVFNRCLKSLESKGLVKTTTSSKFPTRKLYILSHLQPLEEVSGGPFYTDGVIDEEYVHHLCLWIEDYVRGRSWHFSAKTTPRKRKADISKSKDAAMLKMEDSKSALKERGKRWLPMPAGYIGYPKVPEITRAVNDKGLSSVTMKEAEVRQLLDLLCWDGRLMKVMGGQAYKSVHNTAPAHDEMRNGLVESPCGRCPVFDLCEEGGPVNARTCTYFQDWLQI